MNYRGDFAPGSLVYFLFTIVNATGLPVTFSDSPAVRVYKDDGTGESAAGITLGIDHDGRTGLNRVKVDTSADGAFYAAGHDFHVVITVGNADSGGTSVVGYVVGGFSIANRLLSAAQADELAAVPTHLASLADMVRWMFTLSRNKLTQSSSTQAVRDNADSSDIATASVSDSGTVFSRGKYT